MTGMTSARSRLHQLASEDQADRKAGLRDDLADKDQARQAEVRMILDKTGALGANSQLDAALILQHSPNVADIEQAHHLAEQAYRAGHPAAGRLVAMTADRACMYRGQPQKFGTQMAPDDHSWRLWDVDPETTDADRASLGLPPLAELAAEVTSATAGIPVPPPDAQLPEWLSQARIRWRST